MAEKTQYSAEFSQLVEAFTKADPRNSNEALHGLEDFVLENHQVITEALKQFGFRVSAGHRMH